MSSILRQIGIQPSLVTREQCLRAGFSLGFREKFKNHPFEQLAQIYGPDGGELGEIHRELELAGLGLHPDINIVNRPALGTHMTRVETLCEAIGLENRGREFSSAETQALRAKLKDISLSHDAWFRTGLWVFESTFLLGFQLVAHSQEEEEAVLYQRQDVTQCRTGLLEALLHLRWPPLRAEALLREQIDPHLRKPGLRKHVCSDLMAVMQDLQYEAHQEDLRFEPPPVRSRLLSTLIACVKVIPFIGGPLAELLWGKGRNL